ncbi:MAG: hypothetical protein M0P52_08465 [Rhodoferax sp.]|nr:hypothetical protein [Rhodoferax sp.]
MFFSRGAGFVPHQLGHHPGGYFQPLGPVSNGQPVPLGVYVIPAQAQHLSRLAPANLSTVRKCPILHAGHKPTSSLATRAMKACADASACGLMGDICKATLRTFCQNHRQLHGSAVAPAGVQAVRQGANRISHCKPVAAAQAALPLLWRCDAHCATAHPAGHH